ncbi:methyltransferase-like protein 22 [Dysidea avara]|uniref:methyltransferase-like protein 22 n=1 Tax=Dysidea avara TaxID=196820 RepID=UPI00332BB1C1
MAEAGDLVLSDVHRDVVATRVVKNVTTSRFPFQFPDQTAVDYDDDGDAIVYRREQCLFLIEHAMATPFSDVGQQVWHGALLLADLLLNMKDRLGEIVVLELGGGVGLATLAAALHAKTVICTDIGDDLLEMCCRNVDNNLAALGDLVQASVLVRKLDWLEPTPPQDGNNKWSQQDLTLLSHTNIIMAADVIYDDDITDAFFSCLTYLYSDVFTTQSPLVYVALEKRINFTLEHLAAVSPAHQHFMQCITRHHMTQHGSSIKFTANQIPLQNITHCFNYDRSDHMEVWELRITKCS